MLPPEVVAQRHQAMALFVACVVYSLGYMGRWGVVAVGLLLRLCAMVLHVRMLSYLLLLSSDAVVVVVAAAAAAAAVVLMKRCLQAPQGAEPMCSIWGFRNSADSGLWCHEEHRPCR